MGNTLIAIETDSAGVISRVSYCNIPWDGIKRASLEDINNNIVEIDNIRVTDKHELVCLIGDISKYTTISNGGILKKSYVVLAKAKETSDFYSELYFITDGVSNPTWLKSEDIKDKIFKDKYDFANAKFNIDLNKLEPIGDSFEEVDYIEFQREYRRFLKKNK